MSHTPEYHAKQAAYQRYKERQIAQGNTPEGIRSWSKTSDYDEGRATHIANTKDSSHGNSRSNSEPQHNYIIYNSDGEARKTGVGTGLAADGKSQRAESQLDPGDTYEIADRHPEAPGARGRAYDREQELTNELYEAGEPMDIHQRPTYKPDDD